MTGAPPQPGWWLASDGQWYPPTAQPGPLPETAPPAQDQPGAPATPYPAASPTGFSSPQQGAAYGTQPHTSGLAIASLVVSLLWFFGVGSAVAVVLGFIARSNIKKSQGRETGDGLAIAGIVIGFVGIAGAIATVVAIVSLGTVAVNSISNSLHRISACEIDAKTVDVAIVTYQAQNSSTGQVTESQLLGSGGTLQSWPSSAWYSISIAGDTANNGPAVGAVLSGDNATTQRNDVIVTASDGSQYDATTNPTTACLSI